jgi:cold-inducible RNA-binding protein
MSKKLFVGNLSFQTTESEITNTFEQCGAVESVSIITDRDTGRSKGFGFVVMEQEDGAEKAIAALHGSELNGRTLTVNEAKPMVRRDFGGGDRRGGRRDRY